MIADSSEPGRTSRWVQSARWVPFLVMGASSVWASGRAPEGRRPPDFDWSLSAEAVLRALSKRPHIVYMLLLFLLATLAVGLARRWWAALMTLAIGVLWELVQTTAVGQNPRLADLAPDMVFLPHQTCGAER